MVSGSSTVVRLPSPIIVFCSTSNLSSLAFISLISDLKLSVLFRRKNIPELQQLLPGTPLFLLLGNPQ